MVSHFVNDRIKNFTYNNAQKLLKIPGLILIEIAALHIMVLPIQKHVNQI